MFNDILYTHSDSSLFADCTCSTSVQNADRSLRRSPRLSQGSLWRMWNLLGRSMFGKTWESRKAWFSLSSRASSVTYLPSCCTGSICQRTASLQARVERATRTETTSPFRSRNRLRHLPPRRTTDMSLGNISAILATSSSRRACVRRRKSIEPNCSGRPYPINSYARRRLPKRWR